MTVEVRRQIVLFFFWNDHLGLVSPRFRGLDLWLGLGLDLNLVIAVRFNRSFGLSVRE